MKTIRNKQVMDTFKKYLIDCMDFSGYVGYFDGMDTEPETDSEKVLAIHRIFTAEKSYEIKRVSEKTAFKDWLQGLASALTIDFTYYDQMKLLSKWLEISEDQALEKAEDGVFWQYCTTAYFEMLKEAKNVA